MKGAGNMKYERIRAWVFMLAVSAVIVGLCGPVYDGVKAKQQKEMAVAAGSDQSRKALEHTADGVYEGAAEGFGGELRVRVQVEDQAIVDIEADASKETAQIGGAAAPKLIERILESQSLQVDAISGATRTSEGILGAVEQALFEAGADVELLKSVAVEKNGVDEELSTQIVVVGGGASGTAAALQAAEAGGMVLFETKATELIMENGKAAGICAEKADGGILTIHADAVILATGGFGGNEALVEETFGEGYGVSRVGTNIGTGIEMAVSAGADAGYEKAITMHYGLSRGGTSWGSELNSALLNPYLHVDVDGNRFMNEEDFIFEPIKSSDVIKSLPQRKAYEIFDSTMIETVREGGTAALTDVFGGELAENPTKFIEMGHEIDTSASYEKSITPVDLTEEIEALVAEGKIISAESPKELAEKLDMTHLEDTIARYNELCDRGEDTDHFKSAEYLDRLEGTLYAVPITPSVFLGTLGGIEINSGCEVIDPQGKAIAGLYAAGSDTSGVYGNSYVFFEGGTLGYAYNSGRIAGQSAAEYVK